jgi:hypothetical protein
VPIGDAYPITSIALPDGKILNYSYATLATVGGVTVVGLTNVMHPDGAHTTISGAVNTSGDLDVSINDPAEVDAAHQQKIVTLSRPSWVDPLSDNATPWAVRAVRNAADELVYANQRIVTNAEQWTVILDH